MRNVVTLCLRDKSKDYLGVRRLDEDTVPGDLGEAHQHVLAWDTILVEASNCKVKCGQSVNNGR